MKRNLAFYCLTILTLIISQKSYADCMSEDKQKWFDCNDSCRTGAEKGVQECVDDMVNNKLPDDLKKIRFNNCHDNARTRNDKCYSACDANFPGCNLGPSTPKPRPSGGGAR